MWIGYRSGENLSPHRDQENVAYFQGKFWTNENKHISTACEDKEWDKYGFNL